MKLYQLTYSPDEKRVYSAYAAAYTPVEAIEAFTEHYNARCAPAQQRVMEVRAVKLIADEIVIPEGVV